MSVIGLEEQGMTIWTYGSYSLKCIKICKLAFNCTFISLLNWIIQHFQVEFTVIYLKFASPEGSHFTTL